jgi:hypothetical protein
VFQLAVADEHWHVVETQRLTRTQCERWFLNREYSSGSSRYLGRISKKGDRYLRMLLTHGARSVLRAAKVADNAGREVCGVRRWALDVQARSNHNKAACALANSKHPVATTLAANRRLVYWRAPAPGCQRVGSNSSMRLFGCVGRRVSTSVR